MLPEIVAGFTALNTARQMAGALVGIRDETILQTKIYELNEKIADAQNGLFAANADRESLADKVRDLEAKIATMETWSKEADRYRLTRLAPNVMAMQFIDEKSNDPAHLLCANCFSAKKKSYLQQVIQGPYYDRYKCHGCGEELLIDKGNPPSQRIGSIDHY